MGTDVVKNVRILYFFTDSIKIHQENARIIVPVSIKVLQTNLINNLCRIRKVCMDGRSI